MVNGTDYVKYIKNRELPFYSEFNADTSSNVKEFNIGNYEKEEWNSFSNDNWHYMMNLSKKLPDQGWKIHISANLHDAQELLKEVSNYLLSRNISFKFIPDIYTLELSYSKNADRIEAGKFITIYPQNDLEFCNLLDPLKEIVDKYLEGPFILNDQQWKESNVFYRYGGFKEMTTVKNGVPVFAIRDMNGNYVEDKRVPYYCKPDFIEEPAYVRENNEFPSQDEFNGLNDLTIEGALHFSNAGGVYAGKYNNKDVIIKEGRPFIGIDQNEYDGFERVKSEYSTLCKLKDIDEVVSPIGYKEIWKHNYLIEEEVSGITLGEYMSINYPFNNNSDVSSYKEKAFIIINKLIKIVEKLHNHGVAIVDFQLENIMIDINENCNDVDVKIIDFESAAKVSDKYKPNLVTPDYTSFQSKTFGDADWYILNRIARNIFLPTETVMFYSPELEKIQNDNIARKFGDDVVKFLNKVEKKCAKYTEIYRQPAFYKKEVNVPNNTVSIENLENNISSLENGIVSNLNYNSINLIYGDIGQYNEPIISNLSICHGAIGAILALNRCDSSVLKEEKFDKWLKDIKRILLNYVSNNDSYDIGLFTGLSGIALVLYDLGEKKIAEKLIDCCNSTQSALDISLYSGLSGIGLVNLVLYKVTKEKKYLNKTIEFADEILERYESGEFDSQNEYEGRMGLVKGWTGPVLFLWKLGIGTNNKKYISGAIKIFDKVISTSIVNTSDGTILSDKSKGMNRMLPYLDTGFAGVAMMVMEMCEDMPDIVHEKYDDIWLTMKKDGGYFCTYQCCLFSGTAGLIIYENAVRNLFKEDKSLNIYLSALNNYLLRAKDKANETLVPGPFGEKCSMDYETGAAGVMLSLLDLRKEGSWVPLLKDNPLNIFNQKKTPEF